MTNNIQNERMKQGLSHKRLSELSGVDTRTIRGIEYGTIADNEALERIQKVLDDLSELREG